MCLLGLENRGCLSPDSATPQKALTVKLPDVWSRATPVFDDENLVSYAGLVPVMALAERAGLSDLIGRRVGFTSSRLQSAGANPAGKLTSIVAGMAAGADSIDDLDAIRSGGMPRLFGGVYAAATLGPVPARVHPRPHPAAGLGVTGPPGRSDRALRAAARDRRAGLRRYRLVAAAGVRPREAGRQLRAHQDRREAGAAQGPVPVGDHSLQPRGCAGAGRDPAPRRPGRLGSGRRHDGPRRDPDGPRGRRHR